MRKLTILIAAWVLAGLARGAAGSCDRLWVGGHELWMTRGEEARLVASDPRGILSPRWSPDGDRIAYAHDFQFDGGVRSEIVIINERGVVVHTLPIPLDSEVNAIFELGWRDDQHPFLEGHVNPSTAVFLEWDLDSRRLLDERVGSWFAVSPNGRYVAQRAHVPHGTPPPYDSSWLVIDGKIVYPEAGASDYHDFAANLAWSSDSSRLALIDQSGGRTEVVIVDPVDGAATHVPIAGAFTRSELSWSGQNTIVIRDGEHEWRVDVTSGKVEKAAAPPDAAQDEKPPAALRDRVPGVAPSAEDTRCRD